MEAVVFCGIQGSGKTTFYTERFLHTHVRISLDLLSTRNRERLFLDTCLTTRTPFVVDNTNPTRTDRERYVRPALEAGFEVVGYFFPIGARTAIARNEERRQRDRIPVPGILGTLKRLEPPRREEGFERLHRVTSAPGGGFRVEPLPADTGTSP